MTIKYNVYLILDHHLVILSRVKFCSYPVLVGSIYEGAIRSYLVENKIDRKFQLITVLRATILNVFGGRHLVKSWGNKNIVYFSCFQIKDLCSS